jgi:hypothetical protein
MMDARNLACQDEIAFASGKRVKVHVAHELRILEALEKYYKEDCPSRFTLLAERLNRARYFWERGDSGDNGNTGERGESARAESATTQAAPYEDLFGRKRPLTPPPVLPDFPIAPLPPPPPPAQAAASRPGGPLILPPPRPSSVALTAEDRALLGVQPGVSIPASIPAPAPAPAPALKPVPKPAPAPKPAPEPAPVPVPAAPSTIEEAERLLAATEGREEIGRAVLAFLARDHEHAALFQASRDRITAWQAQGEGIDAALFQRYSVGFDQPSLFLNLREGNSVYLGPLPPMPAHRELARSWGGELPRDCVMLPVRIRGRLVAVIYADGSKKVDLGLLQRLAAAMESALGRSILRKKQAEAGA